MQAAQSEAGTQMQDWFAQYVEGISYPQVRYSQVLAKLRDLLSANRKDTLDEVCIFRDNREAETQKAYMVQEWIDSPHHHLPSYPATSYGHLHPSLSSNNIQWDPAGAAGAG